MSRVSAVRTLIAAAAAFVLAACSSYHHSPVHEQWGDAQRSNAAAMVANPDAPPWGTGPVGLDPGSTERVAERYYGGQKRGQLQEPKGPAIVIETR